MSFPRSQWIPHSFTGFMMMLLVCAAQHSSAQTRAENTSPFAQNSALAESADNLPDAPSAAPSNPLHAPDQVPPLRLIMAPRFAQIIEPEYQATSQTAKSKLAYSVREIFDVKYVAGVVVAASLSQGFQADPLYGDSKEAFAQRVGAAGARQASQFLLTDGILAPVLHEDTRYYVLGPTHSVQKRISYAITRIFVAKTDGGRPTVNFATLGGYAGASALTQLYYPVRSRDIDTVLSGYGFSLGGKAFANEIAEFCRFFVKGQPKR